MRYDASAKTARALGVTVQPLGVREPNDFGGVEAMDREKPDATSYVFRFATTVSAIAQVGRSTLSRNACRRFTSTT